ncbi:hypothetical protein CC78DRAFT_166520 [Lojkania enalia]|uniref:Polymerase nucleotidyl transferase domain-containing protein n=1 Tax=Lojkania enalia TaxID=147567 RepID=A0A9P4JWQ4_9PLEO|nr:hypothetical protein CC78DRAFT_166520 [Didymosphaeria enalia]
MRVSAAAAIGLVALSSQFGAYASVIPVDPDMAIEQRAPAPPVKPPTVPPPVKPVPPVKPGSQKPNNNEPGGDGAPEPLTPPTPPTPPGQKIGVPKEPIIPVKQVDPESLKPTDDPPMQSVGEVIGLPKPDKNAKNTMAEPIEAWANEQNGETNILDGVEIKYNEGGNTKETIPKDPARPTKPLSAVIDWRSNDGKDKIPLGKGNFCKAKGGAKRDLSAQSEKSPFAKRMSPNQGAQKINVWHEFVKRVNDILKEDPRVQRAIPVYAFGGFSSLSINGRGANGKTSDIDVVYGSDVTADEASAFENAVVKVSQKMAEKGYPGLYMDTTITADFRNSMPDIEAYSHDVAWERSRLRIMHTSFPFQLMNKLDKLTRYAGANNGQVQEKDMQDAKAFLRKSVQMNGGRKLTLEQLRSFGQTMGVDADRVIMGAGKAVYAQYKGFASDVKSIWKYAEMETSSGSEGSPMSVDETEDLEGVTPYYSCS